jgi:tripartite-type tricarboxylate transporter receptor subunit TctC
MIKKLLYGLAFACAAAMPVIATAQDYPNRPIRLVVPFAPGGASDLIARIMAERMTAILGQPMVVENKVGGGGTVGAMEVIRSKPDGYSLSLATVSTMATNAAINPATPYDPVRDFTAIVNIAATPMILAVSQKFPARDYRAFAATLRSNPGRYNFATAGAGGLSHLQFELYKNLTGAFVTHIPYRGSGPALNDTIAGVTDMMLDPAPSILPFVKEGRLTALAVAAPARLTELPDVPTFKELGLEPVNRMAFYGFSGPKGMPKAIVDRLAAATKTALAVPAVRARIEATGALIVGNTPDEFAEQVRREFAVYKDVVVRRKLTPD